MNRHPHYRDYPMRDTDIARALGWKRTTVYGILQRALNKLRGRKRAVAEGFRQAVHDKRRAVDARVPNQPWNDIDAEPDRKEKAKRRRRPQRRRDVVAPSALSERQRVARTRRGRSGRKE